MLEGSIAVLSWGLCFSFCWHGIFLGTVMVNGRVNESEK